ncbi:MAG: hypothetical protein V1899_09715 [Planctomycetota bacterium]
MFGLAIVASLLLTLCARSGALEPQSGERPLHTELKVSGLEVYFRTPLGLRYRPGYLFPLKVRVYNPGTEFNAEIAIVEGEDGAHSHNPEPELLPQHGARIFTLPARATNVAARLSLVIREVMTGSAVRPERFRARLSDLKPLLKPDSRVILACGKTSIFTRPGDLSEVSQVSAAELPDRDWMYDSLDMVVLTDRSFDEALPEAKQALRRWLLSGGRLLVASADALGPAIAAGLLPLPENLKEQVGAALPWWEKHAGLRRDQILKSENLRPVYAYLDIGLGRTAFLFPATSSELATRYGSDVFNAPELQRSRERIFDLRVQPQTFATFAAGAMNSERASRVMIWMSLGALMFVVALLLSLTSRSRLEAVGLPLGLTALLAVMLARFFPEPQLIVSRATWARAAPDGRATTWDEWTFIESFRQSVEITAAGSPLGTLTPLYRDADDLAESRDACVENQGRLSLSGLCVCADQPVLLHGSEARSQSLAPNASASNHNEAQPREMQFYVNADKLKLTVWGPLPLGLQYKRAIWISADGKFRYALNLKDLNEFQTQEYDDAASAIRATLPGGENLIKARAVALSRATLAAARSSRDTLVLWGEAQEETLKPIVNLEAAKYEIASQFLVYSAPVKVVRQALK